MQETGEVQAAIEGLTGPLQVRAINRLRYLGISPELINAASNAVAGSTEYLEIEIAIIFEAMELWHVEDDVALKILNGQEPCPISNHH